MKPHTYLLIRVLQEEMKHRKTSISPLRGSEEVWQVCRQGAALS